jgi:hypothetical protein
MESATLMRFLIARNLDLQKASEMFAQHCKWRDEFVPKGFIVESQIPNQLGAEKTFIQGLDRNGRPLMIVVGCKHLAKERDMEEFKRTCSNTLNSIFSNNLNSICSKKFVMKKMSSLNHQSLHFINLSFIWRAIKAIPI